MSHDGTDTAGIFMHPEDRAEWDHATGHASDAPEVTR